MWTSSCPTPAAIAITRSIARSCKKRPPSLGNTILQRSHRPKKRWIRKRVPIAGLSSTVAPTNWPKDSGGFLPVASKSTLLGGKIKSLWSSMNLRWNTSESPRFIDQLLATVHHSFWIVFVFRKIHRPPIFEGSMPAQNYGIFVEPFGYTHRSS